MEDESGYPGERPQARVAADDMLHAYRNPIRVFEFDELSMLIGADGGWPFPGDRTVTG